MDIKIFLETLGCSKNQVDSEIMIGILEEKKFYFTESPEDADVIIVNTCGFIDAAKEESVNTILELLENKKSGLCKYFIATGCLVERYAEELKREIPEIDGFLGTTKFESIFQLISQLMENEKVEIWTGDIDKDLMENMPRTIINQKHFAYLKIAEGCDNKCTYCIIPKLRGKYRSRKMDDVIAEAVRLSEGGVKELILIAQDTARYGIDIYGEYRLKDLLIALSKIEGIRWIRIQYCYPDVIDDDLINTIASLEKVVKYIDIPIQHSSDRILQLMNRTTSRDQISNLIYSLREKCPDIVIRTTLIVGFPGETEKDFENLIDFVQEMKFEKLGVFSYSREEDTAADKLPNQIDDDIKEERRNLILEKQQLISEELCYKMVGKNVDVIIEELVSTENIYIGRSSFDSPEIDGVVYVHTKEELSVGEIYKVKINDALEYDLIGELV